MPRYFQQRLDGVADSSTSGIAQIMPPRLTRVNETSLSLMPWAIEFQVAWAQAALSVAARTNGEAPAAPVTATAAAKPIERPLLSRQVPIRRDAGATLGATTC